MTDRRRASAYIAKIPYDRSPWKANFKAAIILIKGFLLPPNEAFEILLEEYNPRCAFPLTRQELQQVLRYALDAKDLRPQGWLTRDRRQ